MVRTVDPVDSENSQPDRRFRGSLEANLLAGDVVVAPRGALFSDAYSLPNRQAREQVVSWSSISPTS